MVTFHSKHRILNLNSVYIYFFLNILNNTPPPPRLVGNRKDPTNRKLVIFKKELFVKTHRTMNTANEIFKKVIRDKRCKRLSIDL